MDLHLLMSRAGMPPPLPLRLEALAGEPLPSRQLSSDYLTHTGRDPNDLRKQRWALVVPQGAAGQRLQSLLAPLLELRAHDQGLKVEEVPVLEVPPQMTDAEALAYRDRFLEPPSRSQRKAARYVLFAGPPEQVPLVLQDVVTADGVGYAGRISFDREEDYEAYAAKVVERESRPGRMGQVSAIVASVSDGSIQTEYGRQHLVEPLAQRCLERSKTGELEAGRVIVEDVKGGSADRLLELAAASAPGVLFTMSHGVGPPCGGWVSPDAQRRAQGNLWLGEDQELGAEEVGRRAFMPGGIWFYFACYGAGTPLRSRYQPWIEHLAEIDPSFKVPLEGIARSRPQDGRPFVGAMAQAALANPQGPLAVIAHQDAAWAYSFHDPFAGRSNVERFVDALSDLVEGCRAGIAVHALARFALRVDDAIHRLGSSPADRAALPHLWMERHDLASYVLLGDPATRIALESGPRG